ncbi:MULTISPECIES: hypothetical protein [Planktothrix]|uniref:hypothetical protein n=1 Tax=Planktothrix TaxID=54304 RepID=UPI00041DC2A4|nr:MULTISPECIES: hypothetical protein [Planktothrix]
MIFLFALEFPFRDEEPRKYLAAAPIEDPWNISSSVKPSDLLKYYGFELAEQTPEQIIDNWEKKYDPDWFLPAILESLYQGRYKAISVEHILIYWQRRGQKIHHFTSEFERLICHRFPQNLLSESQNEDTLIIDETPESQGLEPNQTDKLSLKHPDFHGKLKGFMGDPKIEKAKHQSSSVNLNP